MNILESCNLCPRNCNVNRDAGVLGFCQSGKTIKIARAALHFFEEPCISGEKGSGAIFFSGCSLRCVFCQNSSISLGNLGIEVTPKKLSEIFLKLQHEGANNINLVTPTHFVPQIIEAIKISKAFGLTLPILYNSSGYEKVETIKMLEGFIDVYLPDMKYYNNKYAKAYSAAPDYFKYASEAINEMVCQVGDINYGQDGILQKGVIVRHLMLPGLLFDSKKIMDYLYKTYKDKIIISLMNQYTPMGDLKSFPNINRILPPEHYQSLIDYALSLGVKNAFVQDEGSASDAFIPKFDFTGI